MVKKYYATFGSGHPFQDHYQPVVAESMEEARAIMFRAFGDKWGFVYDNKSPIKKNKKPLPTIHNTR